MGFIQIINVLKHRLIAHYFFCCVHCKKIPIVKKFEINFEAGVNHYIFDVYFIACCDKFAWLADLNVLHFFHHFPHDVAEKVQEHFWLLLDVEPAYLPHYNNVPLVG